MFTASSHLKNDIEQPLTFAIGFRQYITMHIHSLKEQLHKRMRRRVEAFERVITKARRDPPEQLTYYEQFGGTTEASKQLGEEKKTGEVLRT